MMIPYWIQHADFSCDEFDPVDHIQGPKIIQSVDWKKELAIQEDRKASGKETCDPGVGFVATDGRILHICPKQNELYYFFYDFKQTRKLFGLFPSHYKSSRMSIDVSLKGLQEVIYRFFHSDHDWLVSNTSDGKPL